jgi:hypothetical protein
MSEAESPNQGRHRKIFSRKNSTISLSAMLVIIGCLGFIPITLIILSTNNFREFSGKPITVYAEAENQANQLTQATRPTQASPSPTASASPTPTQTTPPPTATPLPTHTPFPTAVPEETQVLTLSDASDTPSMDFGEWSCRYCDKMPAKVKMTHYWPPLGGENCWWYYEGYCHSPMKSSVPWETLVEIAAACPPHWLGGVVEVPDIGRRFLCLDTGDKVICEDNVCVVDVLTQTRYDWDGLIFDAIVYYPRVWTDGTRPQVTPFADESDN